MADADRLPAKKDVARALLLKGRVFVHLDPRGEDVMVPASFKRQAQLVLQVGLDMPVPIPDLRVDDAGVYGTLSFNRSPFTCSVPWEAVFAVVGDDGRGLVWPSSMPEEIAAEVAREARRAGLGETHERERRSGERGRASSAEAEPGGEIEELEVAQSQAEPPSAPARRPAFGVIEGEGATTADDREPGRRERPDYLRVVK